MSLNFLKTSPSKTIESLRVCISNGWKLKEELLIDYSNDLRNGEKLDKWNQKVEKWKGETYDTLKKIYFSDIEAELFNNSRATYLDIGMGMDFGGVIVRLEGKISYLYKLYEFLLQHTNISINAKGDVVFQYGDGNKVGIKNED